MRACELKVVEVADELRDDVAAADETALAMPLVIEATAPEETDAPPVARDAGVVIPLGVALMLIGKPSCWLHGVVRGQSDERDGPEIGTELLSGVELRVGAGVAARSARSTG